ncbi:MAG: hypothetical protein HY898_27865 [Deltaproteobacteria bacterium]|nr:hypothetical protein [Deltaproteobacteria bacterium]
MDHHDPPPPPVEECLTSSRKRKYKGGTLIAQGVRTLDEHGKRVADADLYRPEICPACEGSSLHVHDRLERHPRGLILVAVLTVLRFICANPECRATWRVLPAFLARNLWWGWEPIAHATQPEIAAPTEAPEPPTRTRQRWMARLRSSARQLMVLLASRGTQAVQAVGAAVGVNATRTALVREHAVQLGIPVLWRLATLAALVDRLERGIRLMWRWAGSA